VHGQLFIEVETLTHFSNRCMPSHLHDAPTSCESKTVKHTRHPSLLTYSWCQSQSRKLISLSTSTVNLKRRRGSIVTNSSSSYARWKTVRL